MKQHYYINPYDLLHFGKGHDDNPPGRGSGRYPYGSGKAGKAIAYVKQRRENRRVKDIAIGRERLENRIKKVNKKEKIDKLSRKTGWKNLQKLDAAERRISAIKNATNEILGDEKRLRKVGAHTRRVRIGTVALTSTTASSLAIGGSAAVVGVLGSPIAAASLPIAAGSAVAALGYRYFRKTKY